MYVSFFGLAQPPFSIAPDPRYLFMSERHREALAHLLYGVGGGGGFVLLTGEIGAGKTTVCRCFLEQVPAGCQVAYIFNPKLTAVELLQSVCDEFAVPLAWPAPGPASVKTYIDALNRHLLAAHAQGRQCVLVIDEAQNLSAEVLEQLRLLTNLETSERKLLQIILIGQPELRAQLSAPDLEQLAQRVIARYHLGALSAPETAAYVAHRLAVAGRSGAVPFDAAALRRVHALTGGVPRRINLLADRALLGAYAEGRAEVGRRIVERAAAEVFDAAAARPSAARWRWLAAGGLAGACGVAAVAWLGGWAGPAGRGAGPVLAGSAALPASRAATVADGPALAASAASVRAVVAAHAAAGVSVPASAVTLAVAAPALSAAAASAAASGALARPVTLDAVTLLAAFARDEAAGWRALALLWGLDAAALGAAGPTGAAVGMTAPTGAAVGMTAPASAAAGMAALATAAPLADPCVALRARQLRCFRTAASTLAGLRQLDRPGLLTLHTADGQVRVARLVGLGATRALLASGEQTFSLPLDALARHWRGEFATLWRPPAGYAEALQPGARGPAVDALAAGLAALSQQPAPAPGQGLAGALAERLAGFQVAQSLRPDGIAGPTTFMQLSRALGHTEPRLATDLPER